MRNVANSIRGDPPERRRFFGSSCVSAPCGPIPDLRMERSRGNALTLGFLLTLCLCFGSAGLVDARQVRLHWVDRGITFEGEAPAKNTAEPPIFVPSENRIVLRMPRYVDERGRPRRATDSELAQLERSLRTILLKEVGETLARGVDEIEIRTVQDINLGGYLDPGQGQQQNVMRFTAAFLWALAEARKEIGETNDVSCDAAVGSNGVLMASLLIPLMEQQGQNPIDAVAIFDGRATRSQVESLVTAVGGRVIIVNTAGDLPEFPLAPGDCYIAKYDCAKELKADHPEITVFWTDPEGSNVAPNGHLAMMERTAKPAWVKEYTGGNGEKKEKTTTAEFMTRLATLLREDRAGGASGQAGTQEPNRPPTRRKSFSSDSTDVAPPESSLFLPPPLCPPFCPCPPFCNGADGDPPPCPPNCPCPPYCDGTDGGLPPCPPNCPPDRDASAPGGVEIAPQPKAEPTDLEDLKARILKRGQEGRR